MSTEEEQVEEEALDLDCIGYPLQKSIRTRNSPIRYGLVYTHVSAFGIQDLRGYSEALSRTKKEVRLAAMANEVKPLEAIGTWTLVDRSRSCNVIRRQVLRFFAVKRDAI